MTSKEPMLALIDGDIITYSCGFASDIIEYEILDKSGTKFQYKSEAKAYCKKYGYDPDVMILKHHNKESLGNQLQCVKTAIQGIINSVDATHYRIYLSPSKTFRDSMYKQYKANRDPTHKPLWYNEIKEYLKDHHGAIEAKSVEADDLMGQELWMEYERVLGNEIDSQVVVCTTDKDLDMIPGWHYNWNRKTLHWIDKDHADDFFVKQLLMGDRADNIPGLPKVGEKTAEKIMKNFPQGIHNKIGYCQYKYMIEGYTPDWFRMIAGLLWIQRNPNEAWHKHFGILYGPSIKPLPLDDCDAKELT